MINNIIKNISNNTKCSILLDEPLSNHSSIKIGGAAKFILIPSSAKDLIYIIQLLNKGNIPFAVIGNGSNTLFPDEGVEKVLIKMASKANETTLVGEEAVVDSRSTLPNLLKTLLRGCLSGLEFTAGVPASVGGAVVSNLGAFGSDIGSLVSMVEGIDYKGETRSFYRQDLRFEYRSSNIAHKDLILTKVVFKLKKDSPKNISTKINEIIKKRKDSFPLNKPNIGSIFKNPPGHSAAYLIEQAGLKGLEVGKAQISKLHANVIVNLGGATAADVKALVQRSKEEVLKKFNVELIPEINIFQR